MNTHSVLTVAAVGVLTIGLAGAVIVVRRPSRTATTATLPKPSGMPSDDIPMLPEGFRSPTFYSRPGYVDQTLAASVDSVGVYDQGRLEGLRVEWLDGGGRLSLAYGLKVGDEIVQRNGLAFDADEPVDVALEWTLAAVGSGGLLTVLRGDVAWYTQPDVPPHQVPPDRFRVRPAPERSRSATRPATVGKVGAPESPRRRPAPNRDSSPVSLPYRGDAEPAYCPA